MRVIKVTLPDETIVALDAQAAMLDVSRAEVIRKCISASSPSKGMTAADFNALASRAYSFTGGGMDRRQLEGLVAFLFREITMGASRS